MTSIHEEQEEVARGVEMGDSIDSPAAPNAPAIPGVMVSLTFRRSSHFAAFAAALSTAQGEIEGASKDSLNPHFKNKYADLASVWEACRGPLSKNGIAVIQTPSSNGTAVTVTTLLAHRSGDWIESDLTMTAQQNTPQAIGSCITYARRYALSAMVGVAPEDDDGNAASQGNVFTNGTTAQRAPGPAPQGYGDWLTDLEATADNGLAALTKAFNDTTRVDLRNHLTRTQNDKWEALKSRAAKVKAS